MNCWKRERKNLSGFETDFQMMVDQAIEKALQKYSERIDKVSREREKYLKPSDIAKQLQVGKQTVFNWMYNGLLAYYKLGPQEFRITPLDFNDFLKNHYHPKRKSTKMLVKIK